MPRRYKIVTLLTQDHCIRVIKAAESEVAFQASTDASVGALCAFSGSGEGTDQVGNCVRLHVLKDVLLGGGAVVLVS